MTFAGAALIGVTLGLLGSGGSILTVPVLTYLLGQEEKVAIAGSLGVVAAISLVASLPYIRQRSVDLFSLVWFGVPGMFGAYLGAFGSEYVAGAIQLLAFASLAVIAAVLMLRGSDLAGTPEDATVRGPQGPGTAARGHGRIKAAMDGLAVGAVTGFVGVGGGFLIVPALVLLGGLSMRRAVGTSLVIIAMKSSVGFAKYHEILTRQGIALDWETLGLVAGIGMVGSFAGSAAGGRWSQARVRHVFAVALLLVAVFTGVKSWQGAFGSQPAHGPPAATPDALAPAGQNALFVKAEEARDKLMERLLAELSAALAEGGHPAAIDVCSNRAPAIAAEVSRELGVEVGRSSLRLRNPANIAPDWAMEHISNGTAAAVQKIPLGGAGLGVLFPIRLSKGCLGCHGGPDDIAPGTASALARLYPGDRATGFQEGDLRGWLWASVPGQ